ncbi:MAG: zinc ABC transporter substrate-binding protein [Alistipes sp.]|nr:zinc ABC transporter substrate-binding protein [Alistipes sp.]
MRHLFYIGLLGGLCLGVCGCHTSSSSKKPQITVSIEPLRTLTEQIVGSDFEITTLVPSGASPETYEPTAVQMKSVAHSLFYIDIGLIDFEQRLEHSIRENMPQVEVLSTCEGIPVLEGHCGHTHAEPASPLPSEEEASSHDEKLHQGHGVDPHIWLAPETLKTIVQNIYTGIAKRFPDSVQYQQRYELLRTRLDTLDQALRAQFTTDPKAFLIFHPALTYLARQYGLRQISIENEGKEPSAKDLKTLVDSVRTYGIRNIFYQQQFSRTTVEMMARELNLQPVALDPLAPEVLENLATIGTLISQP